MHGNCCVIRFALLPGLVEIVGSECAKVLILGPICPERGRKIREAIISIQVAKQFGMPSSDIGLYRATSNGMVARAGLAEFQRSPNANFGKPGERVGYLPGIAAESISWNKFDEVIDLFGKMF